MNIAMFGQKSISTRDGGGIESAVGELVPRMTARGNRVTCFNRSQRCAGGSDGGHDGIPGVEICNVRTINRRGLAAVTASVSAAFATVRGGYDIVHIHGEGPAAMCWLPKLFGRRVVVTVHGLDWMRAKWGRFASAYIHLGERIGAKYADELIVLSRSDREYFRKQYGRNAVLIPNGVESHTWQAADAISSRWGLVRDSYVLFVGRIVPEKGLEQLIEAWNGIATDKKLVIAGTASDSEAFYKSLKASAGESVVFMGFVEGKELAELFSNAYFYCLPSLVEGTPISLLEAMSYGCCCLVSDIPGCLETAGDSAAVFPHGDTAVLRQRLRELLDRPDQVECYRARAADRVKSMAGWDAVTEKTLALYAGLTEGAEAGNDG